MLVQREENPGVFPIAPDLRSLRKRIKKGERVLSMIEGVLSTDQVIRLERLQPLKASTL